MCQFLAEKLNMDDPSKFFTAGLFSLLDALMDAHLEDILQSMPFSDDLTRAVLCHEGQIGVVLRTVLAYEGGEWDEVRLGNIGPQDIWNSYLEAVQWAGVAQHSMYQR